MVGEEGPFVYLQHRKNRNNLFFSCNSLNPHMEQVSSECIQTFVSCALSKGVLMNWIDASQEMQAIPSPGFIDAILSNN